MQSCANCTFPNPPGTLTCKRCNQYLTMQGEVEYASNPLTKWLIILACVGVVGFCGWYYQKHEENKKTTTTQASAETESAQKPAVVAKSTKKKKRRKQ